MKVSHQTWSFAAVTFAFAVLFGFIAKIYAARYALGPATAAGIYTSFLVQLALTIAPAFGSVRSAAVVWFKKRWNAGFLILIWFLPYILYAAGTRDWRWGAVLRLMSVAVPVAGTYVLLPVREYARFTLQDAAVAVLLISFVLLHGLQGVFNVPVNLDFLTRLYLVTVAAWSWTVIRPVPELGYEFRISRQALRAAALNFCWFALIAIPLGWYLKFTAWNPRWHGTGTFVINFIEIFLFVALLEEMFFRGFLQSLLTKPFGSWWKAQAAVSLLFGLFHILHAPFPNWRYVLLASIAGWFYGSAFRNGGGLMASALVHAMVDTVWRTLFTR